MEKTINLTSAELKVIEVCFENYRQRIRFLREKKAIYPYKEKWIDDNLRLMDSIMHKILNG